MLLKFMIGMFSTIAILLIIVAITLFTMIGCSELGKRFKIIYVFVPLIVIIIGGLIGIFTF